MLTTLLALIGILLTPVIVVAAIYLCVGIFYFLAAVIYVIIAAIAWVIYWIVFIIIAIGALTAILFHVERRHQ